MVTVVDCLRLLKQTNYIGDTISLTTIGWPLIQSCVLWLLDDMTGVSSYSAVVSCCVLIQGKYIGLQPIYLLWVINICLLYVILRYTCSVLSPVLVLFSTINTSFYYVLLLIITKLYLSHRIRINFFVIFFNTVFCCRQWHLWPPRSFNHRQKSNIEGGGSIRGRPIFLKEIMNLI